MDCIHITDLRTRCIIGVNADERVEKQEVVINLALYADLRPAARSDRFADAIDYRAIKKQILELVEASRRELLEALAEDIAAVCLAHPSVRAARVRLDKPGALRFARSVGVQILRKRDA